MSEKQTKLKPNQKTPSNNNNKKKAKLRTWLSLHSTYLHRIKHQCGKAWIPVCNLLPWVARATRAALLQRGDTNHSSNSKHSM